MSLHGHMMDPSHIDKTRVISWPTASILVDIALQRNIGGATPKFLGGPKLRSRTKLLNLWRQWRSVRHLVRKSVWLLKFNFLSRLRISSDQRNTRAPISYLGCNLQYWQDAHSVECGHYIISNVIRSCHFLPRLQICRTKLEDHTTSE